jgi:hypothetical protein
MPDVEEHSIEGGYTYAVKPDHRDGTAVKSQWRITIAEEVASFVLTTQRTWFVEDRGWGLHVVNGKAQNLGVARDRTQQLFVARFEGELPKQYWHGYPADHVRRTDDIPTEGIARDWINREFVPAPKIRKLLKGQRCNL